MTTITMACGKCGPGEKPMYLTTTLPCSEGIPTIAGYTVLQGADVQAGDRFTPTITTSYAIATPNKIAAPNTIVAPNTMVTSNTIATPTTTVLRTNSSSRMAVSGWMLLIGLLIGIW
jgi:hypothetical protein